VSARWLVALHRRWLTLRQRGRFERDLEVELEFHRDARAADLEAGGMATADAARQARIELGMTELHREDCRRARGLGWVDLATGDLRRAWRSLLRTPGYALTAVLVLALPVAASLLLFALVNAYGLRSPAVERAERWVLVDAVDTQGRGRTMWPPLQADALLAAQPPAFEGLYARRAVRLPLDVDGPRQGFGDAVSGNYFALTGVGAERGRVFAAGPGGERDRGGLVLSQQGWHRLFDGADDVVGRRLLIAGQPYEVLGVAEQGFAGTSPWAVLYWMLERDFRLLEGEHAGSGAGLEVSGFLRPMATAIDAGSGLTAGLRELSALHPDDPPITRVRVNPRQGFLLPADREEAVLMALPVAFALLLVLAVAAANLANLVLARFAARRHDLALQAALGASRARLMAPLLLECGLLALVAALLAFGLVALLLGPLHVRLFGMLAEFGIDLIAVAVDSRVALYGMAIALGAALLFGGLPAWLVTTPWANGGRTPDAQALKRANPSRLRGALMVGQLASSVVLVVIAGLIVANARQIEATPIGFDPGRIAALRAGADGPALLHALSLLPQVEVAAASSVKPLMDEAPRIAARVEGRAEVLGVREVDPNYLAVLDLALEHGRAFNAGDAASQSAALVSRATAERLWPGRNALGRTVELLPEPDQPGPVRQVEVVGVVADGNSDWLLGGVDQSALYLPTAAGLPAAGKLLLKLRDAQPATLDAIYRRCRDVAPSQECQPFLLSGAVRLQRLPFVLSGAVAATLGWTALAISCIGLYGLVGFMLVQQRREIGLRMALGASAGTMLRWTMRRASRQILLGLAIGLPFAMLLARVVASQIEQVRTFDLRAFVAEPLLLVAVALLAAWLPARRSARITPSEALRAES
jgi:predicted permease